MPIQSSVALWDIFEHAIDAEVPGNPYTDVVFWGVFRHANREVRVPGFYDGANSFVVRFMPDTEGEWSLETLSDTSVLNGVKTTFSVTPATEGAHGPVRVANKFHFAYADGTPYFPFGTTCYAWTHQPLSMQTETLETLKSTGFNKLRMGVFPKDYPYNTNPPLHHCFLTGPDGKEDFDRPNPEAFRHFERQVAALRDMGVEADVIVFHPYDRWGYCNMTEEQDYRYVAYLAARLAAYRNVWWSLANEYDFLLNTKPMRQWDRFFHILEENDPYRHLKSIHNGDVTANYDHRLPWVSHVCIQNWDVKRTPEWRDAYGKPVVNDEPEYEGNLIQSWGSISAQELVHRFWITVIRGGYAGHGETYSDPNDLIWWAKGGKLHGESWKRIAFLRLLLEEDVRNGLTPLGSSAGYPWGRVSGATDDRVTYIYFGEHQPIEWTSGLPKEDGEYQLDIIDTWAMTVTPARKIAARVPHPTRHGGVIAGGKAEAAFGVELPGKPYLALRVRRIG